MCYVSGCFFFSFGIIGNIGQGLCICFFFVIVSATFDVWSNNYHCLELGGRAIAPLHHQVRFTTNLENDSHVTGDVESDPVTLHWYLATTDAGSNEMGARRIVQADMKDVDHVFFTDTTCLEHSQHLVALSSFKAADKCLVSQRDWRYYSSLPTCSNVCRDIGQELFSTWTDMHGVESAKAAVKTLWPKACAGGWGGCEKPEAKFLACGKDRLEPVLEKVLLHKDKDKQSTKKSSISVDELAIEESKAYSEKMTRWKKKTLECLRDPLWWRCVEVMNKVRRPLSHLSRFLHKQQGQFGHVAQLCTGKARSIFEEFNEVWPKLVQSGCLAGTDSESQFVRDFAWSGLHLTIFLVGVLAFER